MKVATFNVNSVRARLPVLVEWLRQVRPDVVGLQETKVEDDLFPRMELEELGYHIEVYGQPRYNGVALLSLEPMMNVAKGIGDPEWPDDARIIRAEVNGVAVINTYVPNGTAVGTEKFDYKLSWFKKLDESIRAAFRPDDPVVWMGDINVAPTALDLFDPVKMEGKVGFHPDEQAALEACKSWGWTDCFRIFEKAGGHYSFWEFYLPNGFKRNLGWRIDHVYASEAIVGACKKCWIDKEPRGWQRPSDHTPVLAEFDI